MKEQKVIKGIFISDVHLPWNIDCKPIFDYIRDYKPDIIILGGDIIDATGMHGIESWKAEQFKQELYDRDVSLLKEFVGEISQACSSAKLVYLEGNHEERYQRLAIKYPDIFKKPVKRFDFARDIKPFNVEWIPYGDYDSFYKVGDCLFTHGTIYPDAHAKKMALSYLPSKVCYGHIHDFQSYTVHNGDPRLPGRYAITCGCLCGRLPDYKKGQPNKWIHGFADFICVDGVTTITPHIIEKGVFHVGGTIYRGKERSERYNADGRGNKS